MKHLLKLTLLAVSFSVSAAEPRPPLPSGHYTFQHKHAEHPNLQSISLKAKVKGRHITLINEGHSAVFPRGVIAEGTFLWHQPSKQWIIGHSKADQAAKEVGGCSDGPEVVDLENRIYWSC
jgi:hypothetical protein